jgi:sugar phosphate isomerase/epimerase
MRIAGHTMGTPEYTLVEAMHLFREIGLDGVEIIVQDGYRCALGEDAPLAQLAQVKETADALGLKIPCLTPYRSKFNSLDPIVRQQEIDGICKVIEYARVLGAGFIRIYAGSFAQDERDEDGRKRDHLVDSMRLLGDRAQASGVVLVMENHFNTMTVSASQSIAMVEKIGHPAVGILYDQANLTFTGHEDYDEAIALQAKEIRHVHVKDFVFTGKDHGFTASDVSHPQQDERKVATRIVGQGILAWPSILRSLGERGYDGWLSLEYERRWHPQDIPDARIGMKESARYLRALAT